MSTILSIISLLLLIALIIIDYRTLKDVRCLLYGYDESIEDLSVEEPENKSSKDVQFNPIPTKSFYDNGEYVQIMDDIDFEPGVEIFEKHVDPTTQARSKYGV